jgi:hypothetical protein
MHGPYLPESKKEMMFTSLQRAVCPLPRLSFKQRVVYYNSFNIISINCQYRSGSKLEE